ncbi:MAG: type III-B CRISPR-associated protein Cas10/Cmr2 [Thermoguttaceae bacterium]|nr:type III-B CRISPR-associated protein Cas10/Cmr2 [Thermoguttaceae bacterium]MDW8038107.1 type III-B CRISPR-associated protein Cas10/Cmr2 [Thermoguttaceae bacterium]
MSEAPGAGKAFVLFSAGPAQRFIASARTVRDLWTGSFLLAWLTRHAMEPILQHPACGPEAFVLPDMSRDPLPLNGTGTPRAGRSAVSVRVACLPNRFLAEVPETEADTLAQQCRKSFQDAWQEIAEAVRQRLSEEIRSTPLEADWQESVARLWQEQIDSFFDDQDVRAVVVRWSDFPKELMQELLGSTGPTDGPQEDRLWTDRMQLAFRLLAAQKAVRKVTSYQPEPNPLGMYAPKCTLLGTYEQLGPAELSKSAPFWQKFAERVRVRGIRLRRGERLCAPSLVKRFAWPAYLQDKLREIGQELDENSLELRFEDTATVAAAEWLAEEPALDPWEIRRKDNDWNGQWIHWNRPDQDKEEPCSEKIWKAIWPVIRQKRELYGGAPSYYAILMIDGDRMGQFLNARAGRKHPQNVSQILACFALDQAETIVQNHKGTLIYSGGDDLLALLPTSQVLGCAFKVRQVFTRLWDSNTFPSLLPTLSAGIAIVHYKEDLRFALEQARLAEKRAKDSGRDILCITLCRRSGEHQTALCPWEFVETVQGWVQAFLPKVEGAKKIPGASDRWAYHLYQELPTLEGLPLAMQADPSAQQMAQGRGLSVEDLALEAIQAELRRQMNRAEEATRKRLFGPNFQQAGDQLAQQFASYRQQMKDRNYPVGQLLRHFLTLCQMASFLARRREE